MLLRSNTCAVTSRKASMWVDVGTGTTPILAGGFAFSHPELTTAECVHNV